MSADRDASAPRDPSDDINEEPLAERIVSETIEALEVSDGDAPATKASSWSQLAAEEFSFDKAIGGVRGLIESMAPGVVFVVTYVVWSSLSVSLISSLAVAIVATIVRLVQRTPVTQAIAGVGGVALGAAFAWWTGQAADYFTIGLLTNALMIVGCLISILVRWPAIGIVVGLLRSQGFAWRSDAHARKVYSLATWMWIAMFALRLLVQVPLRLDSEVAWLGTARIVMGVPLWAFTLWLTWLMVRKLPSKDELAGESPHSEDPETDGSQPDQSKPEEPNAEESTQE